ncbi:MAG: thioredoxin domain-containing protein [Gammaproteobacteria bacterium]|nr:thioredoxin domain-containing protein [Gammaproteobacteria bacterium]
MIKQNRLQHETSPYLLQHANNPVDWHPWGPEAISIAKEQNKPILLSIGYSACHWCHVMAHESFEDANTARVMNELFINIKVDREERPDLDKIYQRAHQIMTQRPGGWPLTVFLMPDDHIPFFAGTYFPKEARYQLPAFTDLLTRIADFFKHNRKQLDEQNHAVQQAMGTLQNTKKSDEDISPAPLDMSRKQLENNIDWKHGGFGKPPKFPHPANLERLLRHWAAAPDDTQSLKMACHNLVHMANGGINDQLGGGFCRYSVDEYWMIPHFEKMLYDNGPLLTLYSEAWSATGDPLFLEVTETTSQWVIREMQANEGGYYSSIDADSEGKEGTFYAWTKDEITQQISTGEFKYFSQRYGIDKQPNFEGKYYPHVTTQWDDINKQGDHTVNDIQSLVNSARNKLFNYRKNRIHPTRDDKILTSWNALMIKGMASAGRHLGREDLIDSAFRSLDFIKQTLWKNNRLLATCKDGKAHLNAYLDDYAFLIDAVLELLQARWRDGDLSFALDLANVLLEQFEDQDKGGFFFTSHDHEKLIERPKHYGDDATPSGNGIAAYVLQRLGHITGNKHYTKAAERTLQSAWETIKQIPYAHNTLLLALEEQLYPPQIIILRGQKKDLREWHKLCVQPYAPRRICFAIDKDCTELPGLLASRKSENKTLAYVCNGTQCLPAIDTLEELNNTLTPTNAHVGATFSRDVWNRD